MPPSADVFRASLWREQAGDRAPAWVRRLVATVPLRSRVLEVGCGTGGLARELAARRGARVTAIDVSANTINIARLRTSQTLGIEYCVADICELAPEPECFDVVICADTLHSLPREQAFGRAVPNMAGAVKCGGLLVLADVVEGPSLLGLLLGTRKVRSTLRAQLPGVSVRRHLGGRYSAIWQRR
jgi:2-polyprenyl-3-methyl-5-hydroxy-6-metoxy-1,4-benzoquinol methylase